MHTPAERTAALYKGNRSVSISVGLGDWRALRQQYRNGLFWPPNQLYPVKDNQWKIVIKQPQYSSSSSNNKSSAIGRLERQLLEQPSPKWCNLELPLDKLRKTKIKKTGTLSSAPSIWSFCRCWCHVRLTRWPCATYLVFFFLARRFSDTLIIITVPIDIRRVPVLGGPKNDKFF